MLLVADEGCSGAALCRPLAERLEGRRAEVLVVAPALISATRYLDSDVDAARDAAELRLVETLAAFEARGIEVRGEVGSESPLEAIAGAHALRSTGGGELASTQDAVDSKGDMLAPARREVWSASVPRPWRRAMELELAQSSSGAERIGRALVGATSVGPHGGESLGLLSAIVHAKIPVRDVRNMIYAYPTVYGAVGETLGAYARGIGKVIDPSYASGGVLEW